MLRHRLVDRASPTTEVEIAFLDQVGDRFCCAPRNDMRGAGTWYSGPSAPRRIPVSGPGVGALGPTAYGCAGHTPQQSWLDYQSCCWLPSDRFRMANCAKRRQFPAGSGARGPAGVGRLCKTNPIWGRNVRNEPNFAPLQEADRENCAEQSQTWGDWGIWATAVATWSVARPGSGTCKTNPVPDGVGARGPGGRGPIVQNEPNLGSKRAKRTQFGGRNVRNEPNFAPRGPLTEEIVQNEPDFAPGIDRPARPVPVGPNIPLFQDSIRRSSYVKCAARCLDRARHDKREGRPSAAELSGFVHCASGFGFYRGWGFMVQRREHDPVTVDGERVYRCRMVAMAQ
jgi:hypothetical protein